VTHIGYTKREIEPFVFGERATTITVLAFVLFTPVFAECAYYRRRGDVLLSALFLHEAEYREAEECENDNEARNLEKEDG
jgi:hypothetical protein